MMLNQNIEANLEAYECTYNKKHFWIDFKYLWLENLGQRSCEEVAISP